MIKSIKFEKDRTYLIDGVFNKTIDEIVADQNLFPVLYQSVRAMNTVKKIIIRSLEDDNKIIGRERIEIIQTIDKYLFTCFTIALIFSPNRSVFNWENKDVFHIMIECDTSKYLTGKGKILLLPKITGDYSQWFDKMIIESFKDVIQHSSKPETHPLMKKELVDLIYLLLSLRYKFEYVNS